MFKSLQKTLRIAEISGFTFAAIIIVLSSIGLLDIMAIGLVPVILISIEDPSRLPAFITDNNLYSINSLLILLAGVFIFKLFFTVLNQRALIYFISKKQANLTSSLLNKYLDYDYINFHKLNSNELIRNLINSIPLYINQSLRPHMQLISETIISLLIVGLVFYVNWFVPLMVLIFLGLFGLVFVFFTRKKIESYGKDMINAQTSMYEISKQSIEGFEDIKAANLSKLFLRYFNLYARRFTKSGANYYGLIIIPRQMMEAVFIFVFCLSLYVAVRVGLSWSEIIPIAGTVSVASFRLIALSTNILNYINDIKFASTAQNILFQEIDKKNDNNINQHYLEEKIESIELKKVSFNYNYSNALINDVDIKVSKGEVLCLMGPSGCGKSTLSRLILGLLKPNQGQVLINEKIISNNKIIKATILSQNNFVFNGSIRDNILLGVNEDEINDSRIIDAIKLAGIDKFIDSLPRKMETVVGDNGHKLSGGQKQRLILARVFCSSNEVLVLDEPTSSLDATNSSLIFNSINTLKKDKIIIVITHDLLLSQSFKKVINMQ